ncbi:hypothetical protein BDY19DRAFT_951813 [Irpex rosettiformis]|uniref:Uncharacterized protein n=1 Tax=Irpex rosettiformis TaxID=378272 RepID=A0ACB8U1G9_9APHY|nr:hypothetical protein BDY19DRAFT_951813 [Irpex rosettiformis]
MSARLSKKRKGRGNQINRERTVTTLTEGSEGSFMTAEEPPLNITSSPFSVASSSTGPSATISPSFSMSSGFPPFSYGYVPGTVIQTPTFGQSAQPAHFYPAQSLPPGQNDLEILERLKETIKNNQHELFTPTPRPAALASVYLGPNNLSRVPPHPEQIPHEYSSHNQNGRRARADSTASSNDARKVVIGEGGSQTNNKGSLSSGLSLESIDSGNKSMDMDPPGLNTSLAATDNSQRTPRLEHASVTTAGKYDTRGLSRSATEKILGEGSPLKGDIVVKEEPRHDRGTDWSRRVSGAPQDTKASRYEHDRYGPNGRSNSDTRYSNNDSSKPPRYQRGDYDREKSRERDRDRDLDRDRDHRRYEPNRFNDRRNDDKFRPTDNRRPPPEQRHYEPRYDSRSNDPVRRWDSKSSVDSGTSPATRSLDTRSTDNRPPRPLANERSFDSRDGRPLGEERSFDSRGSRSLGQERSFESRGPRPLSTERSLDQRNPRPPPADGDRTSKPVISDDRRSYPPPSSERPLRSEENAHAPLSSPSKPVIDDRRPVNNTSAARPLEQRTSLDDRNSTLSQSLNSSSIGADRRPAPPPLAADRQRPLESSSDRTSRGLSDYPPRQRSGSVAAKSVRPSSPVRPLPPPQSDRNGPLRPQLPLEERIGRPASLQERLGSRPPDAPPPVRHEDKGVRPPPPTEQRSTAPSLDGRRATPDQPSGNKPTAETNASSVQSSNARNTGPDASRPPPPQTREPARLGAQTNPPAHRSTGPPAQRLSYPGNPPVPSAAEETFKPRGAAVSPRRAEYRPLDRSTYPDRYERDAPREQRPDTMEVGAPRYQDHPAPQSYTRPSPPPFGRPEPRNWLPAREHPYPRHPHDSAPAHATYEREWRGEERAPYEAAWEQRTWDRERQLEPDHELSRDPRYFSRDASAGWEAREARERYPPPEEPPVARPYDSRLVPRGTEGYSDGRTYERVRYPETSPPVGAPRVRPRSPSPVRRAGINDMQPPLKRPRDDAYAAPYYSAPPVRDLPREYPPTTSIYYDDVPPSAGPAGPSGERRDRVYRERDYSSTYDARHAPAYTRDDRRYG